MKSLREVELELSKVGVRNQFWCKPEIKELAHLLTDNENIENAVNGRYQGGFALIVITNHRILLVDKKMWFMSIEDLRFEMVTEVDFAARLLDATISIRTINKVLHFSSFHQRLLRDFTQKLQKIILESRQMNMQQQSPAQQFVQYAVPFQPIQQPDPVQPAQFYSQPATNYTRPTRLRRVGSFPTASLTVHQQNYSGLNH